MTEEEQREYNIILAAFDGWEPSPYSHLPNKMYKGDRGISIDQLDYNTNWETLMPIVERISLHMYRDGERAYPRTFGMLNVETGMVMVRFNRSPVFEAETLKLAAFKAAGYFVKLYLKDKEKGLSLKLSKITQL